MDWVRSESSLSPNAGRSPANHKRRSMLKCVSCRKKRIKCMPISRTWPGQRCIPCEEHDIPCGPNVHSRQSTTTQLGNTSFQAQDVTPGCLDHHTLKTGNDSIREGMKDPDGSWNLTGLEADWGYSVESSDAFSLDFLLHLPFEEPQLREETWSRMVVSHTDQSSRESSSAVPGFVNLAPSDDCLEIDKSFIRLGELRIVFEAVESRTRAVTSLGLESAQESVKHALKFISWCIASKHDTLLSNIVALAGKLEVRVAEGAFLRALRALEELDCIDSRGGPARESQIKLRSTIIKALFDIYSTRKDIPEAEYWLRRLDMLHSIKDETPSWTARQLAYSLQRTSKMAQAVLDDLELDQDVRAKLSFSKTASFPAIHRAIHTGHMQSAQLLSYVTAALTESDLIGRTALHIAAETGQVNALRVQFSPDVINHRDVFECTPLFLASCNGNFESFAYLLERGADTKARTGDGRSVLAAACSAGHLEIVQYLLKQGSDPNEGPPSASSPLYEAASHGHSEICKSLIEKGAFADCVADLPTSRINAITDDALKEISDVILTAKSKKTLRASAIVPAPENSSEALSDLATPSPPTQFLFSKPSFVFPDSTASNQKASTCDSAGSGLYNELSCMKFNIPLLSIYDDLWPQAGFPMEMGEMEFGTMQNPFKIVE